MEIVCISDTHGLHDKIKFPIPDGDILICAGDITKNGDLIGVEVFNDWLKTLPHKYKICIAGNHDFCFQNNKDRAISLLTEATYLEDSFIKIEGFKIYGSPYTSEFFNWAFMLPRGEALKNKWDQIPDDIDILVTHGPSSKCLNLDLTSRGEFVGDEYLYNRKQQLKKLQAHIFGHIHEGYGLTQNCYELNKYIDINASICNLKYQPINKPFVINLGDTK